VSRRAELAERLVAVRARIAAACATAGRDPGEITLIAVTKTYPASDVLALAGLGLTDFGENRDKEAAEKAVEVRGDDPPLSSPGGTTPPNPPEAPLSTRSGLIAKPAIVSGPPARTDSGWTDRTHNPIRWHFIGQLQTNKAHSVARYADFVHSVDRVRLVRALDAGAQASGRVLTCLVQVSLDGDPARGGAGVGQVGDVAAAIEAAGGLLLGGIMAVAPLGVPPEEAFGALPAMSAIVRAVNPGAVMISAGMSGDIEAAVANGATHLRIGTALLGNRSLPVL
jgi:uncharacterized pyridoxal phosphate-containing UPF0001 family protein